MIYIINLVYEICIRNLKGRNGNCIKLLCRLIDKTHIVPLLENTTY